MRDHLASVYSGSALPTNRPPQFETRSNDLPYDLSSTTAGEDALRFPSDDVKAVMKRLPRRKAPGVDCDVW